MKVYLAGPMSGIPKFNYPAFEEMAALLRNPTKGGHDVYSPHEGDFPEVQAASLASPDGSIDTLDTHGLTWGALLARAVKNLADGGFDAVVVLPGWQHSRGARLETFVAHLAGVKVYDVQHYYGGGMGLWEVPTSTLLKAWEGEHNGG